MAQITNSTSNAVSAIYQQTQTVINTGRLESIFQKGICGSLALRNDGQEHQAGFDEGESFVAYMNCVTKPEKLHQAVFDPADGIYHISIEYKGDDELVQKLSDKEKVKEKFNELTQQIPNEMLELYEDSLKSEAFVSALNENDSFLKTLSDRCCKAAVFVIDGIKLTDNEEHVLSKTTDGFFFIKREKIDPTKIKHVLLSQKFNTDEIRQIQEKNPSVKFHFVAHSVQDNIPFSYNEQEGIFTRNRQMKVNIGAPDFLPELSAIFTNHFATNQKPMFIHTTRL
ncbi:MAG: hypothetical protein JSS60_05925 [Verrucomicrobia bacterium]|nr:hypothetical protein [Verrucomicrobiota bacterium]